MPPFLLRFQNEYGIIIESISKKDLSFKAEPWNSDEWLDVLEGKEFPGIFKFYTDIFHIRESTAENPCEGNKVSATDVRFKVLFPTENSSYHEYKGAIKVGKAWNRIDYSIQDGYMVFEVDQVDSFCVLSLVRQEKHAILPAGSQFISEIDNRIQVKFPPNAVTKTEHITFMKMFKVQLPLNSITDFCGDTEDNKYYICKWKDDGSFEITDLQPLVSNELVCFEDNSFSGYGCVGTHRSNSTSSLVSVVQEAYGLMKWCKILFFVGKLKNNNLPIMLECVDLQRVSDVCEKREKYGYQFVPEWISKDLFLSPDKTIITIDVKGIFRIPKESGVKHPRMSFVPVARDNFTRFLVELVKFGGPMYGILVLRENRTILYEIFYDPDTTKKFLPAKINGNRGKKPVVPNSTVKDFFTEKGLSALSQSMSPDTMYNVCIWMDMTTATYETLQQKYGLGTTRGNIALLKTALDQQPHKKKLENLIKALIASGQKSLADKLRRLHSKGKDLHTI
ncbi:unnamed protein product [Mytilus coruscus]|uniref:Death domain-containing protein n=1 Tax=Mytilus coruscus TaxID=42192 RepID=A0A6J7ZZM2_MYTCO|nr:unnamed protein product [Mytilus coruscus]